MKGLVDGRRYECLFDASAPEPGVKPPDWIRTRTVRAGEMLDVESYPVIVDVATRQRAERARCNVTRIAQERVNAARSKKRLTALLDANFGKGDISFTGTYDYGTFRDDTFFNLNDWKREMQTHHLPDGWEDVAKDRRNFISKIKRRIKRCGGDPKALKYIWVIESGREQNDVNPRPQYIRYHLHMVLSHPLITDRTISRDDLDNLWPFGLTKADSVQPDNSGLGRLGAYLTKQRRSRRRWGCSQNLIQPTERISDRKMSRRRSELIGRDVMANAPEIFAKLYPDYQLVEQPIVKYSTFIGGAYIYARLRRLHKE